MAKKEKPEVNIKGLSLAAICNQINAVYGKNTLALASDAEGLIVRCLSTGVHALDFALGGGIPEGRIIELFGPESSLKTTVATNVIANFQKRYPKGKVYFEDGEHSFDPAYARRIGAIPERVGIINADCGEQAVEVIRSVVQDENDVLVIVDSIASLVPAAEIEGSMEQQFMGLHPRLVGRMMRNVKSASKRNMYDVTAGQVTMIGTNQTRDAMGSGFSYETTPGGKAKNFYYSVRIHFSSGKKHAILQKIEKNGVQRERRVGQVVEFEIRKNKVSGSQFESGDFTYYIRPYKGHAPYSFNNEEPLFKMGTFFGLIRRAGDQFCYGTLKAGEDKFKKQLIDDESLANGLYQEIIDQVRQEEDEGLVQPVENDVVPVKKKVKIKLSSR